MRTAAARELREFLRHFNGAVKIAEFVHQAKFFRLRAGPDAALADFIHGLDGHAAGLRDAARELRVCFVKRFLDIRFLLRREILLVGKHCGVVAGGDVIGAHAQQIVKPGKIQLAGEHADGARFRVRIGDDFIRRRGIQ